MADYDYQQTFYSSSEVIPYRDTRFYRTASFWVFLALIFLAVIIQSFLMAGPLKENWYQNLNKPTWLPSPLLFNIIWTVIYFLLAWSTYLGVRDAGGYQTNHGLWIVILLVVNLIVSIVWTYVFFKQRNFQMALWILVALIIVTIVLALMIYRVHRVAGYVFIFYILWLLVALYINWYIYQNNRPANTGFVPTTSPNLIPGVNPNANNGFNPNATPAGNSGFNPPPVVIPVLP